MPGSDRKVSFARFARGVGNLSLLAGLLWAGSYALTANPAALHLYRRAYRGAIGHRYAGQLAREQTADRPTVLLLGPSSVREGFDEQTLQAAQPGWRFINGGASGGSIGLHETLTLLMRQYRSRPDCIVLGLNARMLVDGRIALAKHGFTDLTDALAGGELPPLDEPVLRDEARRALLANALCPPRRVSRQLGMLIRDGLYHAQMRWTLRSPLPRRRFELHARELQPHGEYLYHDTEPQPALLDEQIAHWREMGLLATDAFAQPRHVESLRVSLERCLASADGVVVVIMPEHPRLRELLGQAGQETFRAVLEEYAARGVVVIDRRDFAPAEEFRDAGHLLPSGRERLSQDIAALLVEPNKDAQP